MKVIQCVRLIFEDESMPESIIESIVWSCTCWPTFFSSDNTTKQFVKELRHAKRSLRRGYSISQIFEGTDKVVGGKYEPN